MTTLDDLTSTFPDVARAFSAVHALGLVIGDVNPGSILVLGDGTARLIDVDSFQVPVPGGRMLLCTVAVPLFLPSELHQAPLNSVVRTPDHDFFGLAITIFQMLMLGRHPYVGRFLGAGEMPIESAIVEHRFAFGARGRPPNAATVKHGRHGNTTVLVLGVAARRQRRESWINAYRAAKSEEADTAAELERANRFSVHRRRSGSGCPGVTSVGRRSRMRSGDSWTTCGTLRALEAAHASEPAAAATAAQRLRAAKLMLLQAEADVLAVTGRVPT